MKKAYIFRMNFQDSARKCNSVVHESTTLTDTFQTHQPINVHDDNHLAEDSARLRQRINLEKRDGSSLYVV